MGQAARAWRRPAFPGDGPPVQRLVHSGLAQFLEHGQSRGRGQGIARQGAGLVDGAFGAEAVHHVGAAPVGGQGQAAAQDLAQGGEVGLHAVELLGPAQAQAESGDHLVEDEQGAGGVAQGSQAFQESLLRNQHAHIAGHRFHDDGGDVDSPLAWNRARTLSRSLYSASKVSWAAPGVTPGLEGWPKVRAPDPAWMRKLSPWPW